MITRNKKTLKVYYFLLIPFFLLTMACVSSIAMFDQYVYTQTISLKVDALKTMDMGINDFSLYASEVQILKSKLQDLYEYEKKRPKNEITLKMWDKLLDRDGCLLGNFLAQWESGKVFNNIYIEDLKEIIGHVFDEITDLESRKIKSIVSP